jgi:hypothetical protein
MFIAMNRFRVAKGSEAAFEQVWLLRDSHLGYRMSSEAVARKSRRRNARRLFLSTARPSTRRGVPAEVCERMRRDGGSVFPAHANTGDHERWQASPISS